jgi:Na+-driven multidrug efflux pump
MKNRMIQSLKTVDYRLFGTLLLMGLLPTLYTTLRINFLGALPSDWGFNIASQLSWVNLAYEVLQEGILLPLFFLMGSVIADKAELENRLRTGLAVTGILYGAIAIMIWLFAEPLVVFMRQKPELVAATVGYIRLETIASLISVLAQFIILVLITIKKNGYLLIILSVQMVLTMLLDTFLVSKLPFSLNIGVNGIALGNIVVNLSILALALALLARKGYRIWRRGKWSFSWMKEWLKVGGFSGLESFVRNLAFMLMVVRMVNVVGEQGTFWTANSFIWNWLLLPVTQLGQLIKRDCGDKGLESVRRSTLGYFALTGMFVALWLITIPLWQPFLRYVMNIGNYLDVFRIAMISLAFYIAFAFNNVIDSVFYGLGKTNYMLFQSLVINSVFYGGLFVLYRLGIYKPTLDLIALMFAVGIALDSLLTYGMFAWMLKRKNIRLFARTETESA